MNRTDIIGSSVLADKVYGTKEIPAYVYGGYHDLVTLTNLLHFSNRA